MESIILIFLCSIVWLAAGLLYLFITIEYCKYEYDNILQGLFIVILWPLALVLLIWVLIFGNKIIKDWEDDLKKKDEFKHL